KIDRVSDRDETHDQNPLHLQRRQPEGLFFHSAEYGSDRAKAQPAQPVVRRLSEAEKRRKRAA
ncbi:hypothetical protein ACQUFG_17390, partial [Enterococcus gallinarum]|uniref:hypothetical protein n=1 Tax=Enterococcus gallinarum TaxID=1353 RepID=UPI003D09DDD2